MDNANFILLTFQEKSNENTEPSWEIINLIEIYFREPEITHGETSGIKILRAAFTNC